MSKQLERDGLRIVKNMESNNYDKNKLKTRLIQTNLTKTHT